MRLWVKRSLICYLSLDSSYAPPYSLASGPGLWCHSVDSKTKLTVEDAVDERHGGDSGILQGVPPVLPELPRPSLLLFLPGLFFLLHCLCPERPPVSSQAFLTPLQALATYIPSTDVKLEELEPGSKMRVPDSLGCGVINVTQAR